MPGVEPWDVERSPHCISLLHGCVVLASPSTVLRPNFFSGNNFLRRCTFSSFTSAPSRVPYILNVTVARVFNPQPTGGWLESAAFGGKEKNGGGGSTLRRNQEPAMLWPHISAHPNPFAGKALPQHSHPSKLLWSDTNHTRQPLTSTGTIPAHLPLAFTMRALLPRGSECNCDADEKHVLQMLSSAHRWSKIGFERLFFQLFHEIVGSQCL